MTPPDPPLRIEQNALTAELYRKIRGTAHFVEYQDSDVEAALGGSLFSAVAYSGHKPVGIVRVVGDGRVAFFIKDLVVIPGYQGRGIGRLLMESVFEYLNTAAADRAYIGLMSTPGKEAFYEKLGFVRRPNAEHGSGMLMFFSRGVH
jgi:GNAT superfamily N-acetyltransferase